MTERASVPENCNNAKKTYIATSFRNQTKQKKRSSDPYCMLAIFLHWKITYIINKQNEHRQQT